MMLRPLPSLVQLPHSTTVDMKRDRDEDDAESDSATTMGELNIEEVISQYPEYSLEQLNEFITLKLPPFDLICLLAIHPELIVQVAAIRYVYDTNVVNRKCAIFFVVAVIFRIEDMFEKHYKMLLPSSEEINDTCKEMLNADEKKHYNRSTPSLEEIKDACKSMLSADEIIYVVEILKVKNKTSRFEFAPTSNDLDTDGIDLNAVLAEKIALGQADVVYDQLVDAHFKSLKADKENEMLPVLDVFSVICHQKPLRDIENLRYHERNAIMIFVKDNTR